jgi:hypothetical protein
MVLKKRNEHKKFITEKRVTPLEDLQGVSLPEVSQGNQRTLFLLS